MDIEKIIRAWKAEEDDWEAPGVASPVGVELMEEELLEVGGGVCAPTICLNTCELTCGRITCGTTCPFTCGTSITATIGTGV